MTGPEQAVLHAAVGLAAFLYASVGHGGASAYLAVLALLAVPRDIAVPTALLLNILVSAVSFSVYRRAGHFSWSFTRPFLVTSIPAAYLGGLLTVSPDSYSVLLALALSVAAFRLWIETSRERAPAYGHPPARAVALACGAGIGLVSGILGIGGGVFLSPICLLLGWADPKKTAATSACFILLNSAAALAGHSLSGAATLPVPALPLVLTAFLGGWLGSRLGATVWGGMTLRRTLGAVLGIAGLKLLFA